MQFAHSQFTDCELIKEAIAGDKQAFGFLYERYLNVIYKYLLYRIDNAEDAEDLTEHVFIKAWLALPTFRPGSGGYEFKAWLFRIAHNSLMDHFRTKKDAIQIEFPDQFEDNRKSTEQQVIVNQDTHQLRKAMGALDEISRQVILLRFMAGLKAREIGRMLGITEGNVRLIQFRAIKTIQEKMGKSYE